MENKTPGTTPEHTPEGTSVNKETGRVLHNADQKRILKFWDLMGIAVGQIIGSGIMVLSIIALQKTGRSISLAFFIAAILTMGTAIPAVFYSSVIRVKGGTYTQGAVFLGKQFSGFWFYQSLLGQISLATYALGMTRYLAFVFPGIKPLEMWSNLAFLTVFFALNWFGTAWMSKAQNFMFYLLIISLVLFVAFGLPKVHYADYFGNLWNKPYIEHGLEGLFGAGAFLTYATGGATVIIAFSGESVNPTRDTPFVIVFSTLAVAVLYAAMAVVIGGVLPTDDVIKAGNLAIIAKQIMPAPAYWFFIIAGAGFALGTTLNSSIASIFRPWLQAIDDGWAPEALGRLNKFGAPIFILGALYAVNVAAIVFKLSLSDISHFVLLIGTFISFIQVIGVMRLPKLFPEGWKKSPYHLPNWAFYGLMSLAAADQVFQGWLDAKGTPMSLIYINLAVLVVALALSYYMIKSGKVQMNVSYELE